MKQNFTVRLGALDGVEAFLSVAQHRNFRRAAAELGVTPSAISQAVRTLETRVGAALFMRTTRSVGLTEAGERFLARAKPAFEELVAASEVARELGQRPAGLLRLSVPRAVVPILLEPLIASFCQAYPDVEVEVAASADLGVSLTRRGSARSVAFLTTRTAPGERPNEWIKTALAADTAVIYMGAGEADSIAQALLAAGKSPATPVALVENASLPAMRAVAGTLAQLPALAARCSSGPVAILLGEVVRDSAIIAAWPTEQSSSSPTVRATRSGRARSSSS